MANFNSTADPLADPTEPQAPERQGILAQTEQQGLEGFVEGAAGLFLPRAGLPGQRGLGDILNEFVEFSSIGDIGDIGAALDPDSGLDPLERVIAASPFLGVGAIGARQGLTRSGQRMADAQTKQIVEQTQVLQDRIEPAPATMLPGEGERYALRDDDLENIVDTEGAAAYGGAEGQATLQRRFSRLAYEAKSPIARPLLQSNTWEELFTAIDPEGFGPDAKDALRKREVENAVRGIGVAVVHLAPNPEIYGRDPQEQEFTAAKVALAKWKRGIELGIFVNKSVMDNEAIGIVGQNIPGYGVGNLAQQIMLIVDFEVATSAIMDPNLDLGTGARLGGFYQGGYQETTDFVPLNHVVIGIVDELLPNQRVYDWDNLKPFDEQTVREKQTKIDYESWEGNGSSMVARAYSQLPQDQRLHGPEDQTQWYPAFNRTARYLSNVSGYSVEQTAGVIAAMSAQTPWVPDNLIGAIHVILQSGTDLQPGTPEYVEAFKGAIIEGGWALDLIDALTDPAAAMPALSAEKMVELGGTETLQGVDMDETQIPAVLDYFADPANVTSSEGQMMGASDGTKRDKIDLILKGNLPAWIVLRGTKTTTFSRLGTYPDARDIVTIDVWNDRLWWGTPWVPRPLAHEGYGNAKGAQVDPEQTYADPVSGDTVSGAVIQERIQGMKEFGWTAEQIDRWLRLIITFPSPKGQARYAAQARSHIIAGEELGLSGTEAQSATWPVARSWSDDGLRQELEAAQTPQEVRDVIQRATLDGLLFTHLEGNPSMEQTAAGKVWEVNDTLVGPETFPVRLDQATKGVQRESSGRVSSSIFLVSTGQGKPTVYADRKTEGVRETLRHTSPTGVYSGRWERHIANKPKQVISAQDHYDEITEYTREDGRKAAGHVVLATGSPAWQPDPVADKLGPVQIPSDMGGVGSPHPAMGPGNRIVLVVENENLDQVREVMNSDYPFGFVETPVQQTQTAASRNPVHATQVEGLNTDQLKHVLMNNDWVAISATTREFDGLDNRRRNRELASEVRALGGEVIESVGRFPDERFTPVAREVAELRTVADEYLEAAGLPELGQRVERTELDAEGGVARADAFEEQPTFNLSPEVVGSYEAFNAETLAQYEALVEAGWTFEWQDEYIEVSPETVHERVKQKHLPVFADAPGFETDAEFREMKANHPLFRDSPITQGGRNISFNELFRAVHDVFGHSMHEYDFTALGEENAWRSHAAMYSDQARRAMTFETRAQNSWQNFGAHTRDASGQPLYGTDKIDPNRPFPPQKAGVLPEGMEAVEQPETGEDSLFVTGITYADAMRLGKKYGQRSVATRYGMLNTDGTYHPVKDSVAFGEDVDADSHTQLVTGQRFSFDYDWDEQLPLPADVDTLADADPVSTPSTQVTVDLGGKYGGANWNVTEKLLRRLGNVTGAKIRLYTHQRNQIPAGYGKASESVFTDEIGVTGSVLHRNGDSYARHQGDVWVPDHELLTLSEDGFAGERSHRTPKEVREIMQVDHAAGLIYLDKDLVIEFPRDQEVQLGKAWEHPFGKARIDRLTVEAIIVDTSGAIPVLRPIAPYSEGNTPALPNAAVAIIKNGDVKAIQVHAEHDFGPALDALSSAGFIGWDVSVPIWQNQPEDFTGDKKGRRAGDEGATYFKPTMDVYHGDFTHEETMLKAEKVKQTREDRDLTERVQTQIVPTMHKITLGPNAKPHVRDELEGILRGLHVEGDPKYARFREVIGGIIPHKLWEAPEGIGPSYNYGIYMGFIKDTDSVAAFVPWPKFTAGAPGIMLNERSLMNHWNTAYATDKTYTYNGERRDGTRVSDFEQTMIHEIGHVLSNAVGRIYATTAVDFAMRGFYTSAVSKQLLSPYALKNADEAFAEAFSRVVIDPDGTHPALVKVVQNVINLLRKDDAARGGFSKGGPYDSA